MDAAIEMVSKTDSPLLRDSIIRQVGKRHQRGQPASKRHLGLFALDAKYKYPTATLRQATNALCPCEIGHDREHTAKCREQLRQQINRAVKLMKSFGYDFTWERIGTEGWKESL
jgi:hypothetical protein